VERESQVLRARVAGMDCGSCALTIEDGLRKLPGVRSVSVDFTTETLEVEGSFARERIEQRLQQLGYRLANLQRAGAGLLPAAVDPPLADTDPRRASAASSSAPPVGFLQFLRSQPRQRVAIGAGLCAALAGVVAVLAPSTASSTMLSWVLAAVVVVVGAPVFSKGLRALVFSRRITIDLLMAIAAVGALLIGEGGEAATVVLLFTVGEGLEGFSANRARDSLRSLMALQPHTATLLERHAGNDHGSRRSHNHANEHHEDHADHGHRHGHGDGHDHGDGHGRGDSDGHGDSHEHVHTRVVAVEALSPGDLILIRPGERIAADGVVRSGTSSIDQSAVTGESIPVAKAAGDTVMAGTINAEGALEVEVARKVGDSTVARIAHLVEQAQAQRSPAERFIDRFARWYTPAVVALAVLVVAVPVVLLHQPLLDGADGSHGWLYRGLALLIVACPCALVISIPVTVVSSLTRLAQLGVLVKGGGQLDALTSIRAIAFDKTGTLTVGRPSVTAIQGRGCVHPEPADPDCGSCDEVIALAASVERSSEHPIAHAIMQSAQARGLESRYPVAGSVTAVAGHGVVGELGLGRIAVGSDALLSGQGAQANLAEFQTLRQSSRTVMTVAVGAEVVGAIGVEDPLRSESIAVLGELRQSKPPVRTIMLTGDNERVAADVAARVGTVDEMRSGLLPADKLAAIHEMRGKYGPVAMVGDGINDAPALASADIGIAMGAGGTAQAMETADVVLMQDDLRRVPTMLRIARRTRSVVKQNIALSLGLKLAFLALVVPGWATLWLAVVADVGATMLVTLNGMRLLREQ